MSITTYTELFNELISCHFYPKIMTEVSAKKEVITGLSLYCSPILKQTNVERVREVVGENFIAEFIPNINEIHIILKNEKQQSKRNKE